jgi:hypothetical protein
MKTMFTSSKLVPVVLGVFLTVRLAGTSELAANGTMAKTGNVSAADSTSLMGLFGLAAASNGLGKRKIGVKKAK